MQRDSRFTGHLEERIDIVFLGVTHAWPIPMRGLQVSGFHPNGSRQADRFVE